MELTQSDWIIIAAYFVLSLGIGLAYTRRAGRNVAEYFLSGRHLPWWLAGTSMVATTFAADTPLAVTEMVARHGVAGNWLWWNFVMSGMLTVFLYARLWRRAGVMTDVEFIELRYAGRAAAFLRGFRAIYLGLLVNSLIMGWVTLGMAKVIGLSLNIGKLEAAFLCLGITAIYSLLSGLWGVVVTDAVQFVIAMVGSVALALFALQVVGGMSGLMARLPEHFGSVEAATAIWPGWNSPWLPLETLLVYIGLQWWASWYPGAEPGGGGYIAQRIFSTKDERHGVLATLWFNIAHYALRPWPWILVALSAVVLYPQLRATDPTALYVRVMVDHLPPVWRGLLLASFAAAYMSTIATHLNWGTSYLINDFYRRFIRPSADERHYVRVSRLATGALALISIIVTLNLQRITGAWELLLSLGAGTGLVYLLRWFWWRINAWSEIAAMATALVVTIGLKIVRPFPEDDPLLYAKSMLVTVTVTTIVWLAVTWLTPAEPEAKLLEFYQRVRPGGPGWAPLLRRLNVPTPNSLVPYLASWALGCVLIYGALFGIGALIFGQWTEALLSFGIGLLAGVGVLKLLVRSQNA
ncbi:MAG: Na+:solute symporter [Blastocatellia bacterium]|nr:Na+:solute symporter [Blastocatellia bacterium]MCS7157963.1 Na+:solute symporter [Blastocatellia bacterium]MCX7752470.1 Na+:solute symporter [Blastocatellia bacterium]MDW8167415.1 sodium:solute symporter family protein [Acidobacteriota bacterium]MDW8257407.1 sodium:solute symporter family protein [Acidobacteriota bacterium]